MDRNVDPPQQPSIQQSTIQASINQQPTIQQPIHPLISATNLTSPPLNYSKRASLILGISQLVIGVLCIIFMIVEIASSMNTIYYTFLYISGHGIWCGVIFCVSGLLGLLSGLKSGGKNMIISYMVMNIISASFTLVLFIISIIDLISTYTNLYYIHTASSNLYVSISMCCLLSILSVVEAVVAIVSAALCCRAVCCVRQPIMAFIQLYDPSTQTVSLISVQTVPYKVSESSSSNIPSVNTATLSSSSNTSSSTPLPNQHLVQNSTQPQTNLFSSTQQPTSILTQRALKHKNKSQGLGLQIEDLDIHEDFTDETSLIK